VSARPGAFVTVDADVDGLRYQQGGSGIVDLLNEFPRQLTCCYSAIRDGFGSSGAPSRSTTLPSARLQ